MVNNFSTKGVVLSQANLAQLKPIKAQEDTSSDNVSCIKDFEEKLSLTQQVNMALNKNYNGSTGSSSFSLVLKNIKTEFEKQTAVPMRLDEKDGDSENDQAYAGFEEKDYANQEANDSQNQRQCLLETFCQTKVKRCISNESCLLNSFDDVDLVYNYLKPKPFSKLHKNVPKSRSCEMFDGLFHQQSRRCKAEGVSQSGNKSVESKDDFISKPLWISGRTVDTFRFLIQWLVVSLLDTPLVILELHANPSNTNKNKVDEANKNAIAKICIEADKKGWTTGDLMAIISRECFQTTNESVEDCARRSLYLHT